MVQNKTPLIDRLLEKGLIPDPVIRLGIRAKLAAKLKFESDKNETLRAEEFSHFLDLARRSPIAVHTEDANRQHYELPPTFFERVLGGHLKYSSGWWDEDTTDLDRAELNMLERTAVRAQLADGQRILELGCGWGSLSLFMADRFPGSRIVAVSNSAPQKEYIDARAAERGLRNLTVLTADINSLTLAETFDRIVSVEMFEHLRNYGKLFEKLSGWLAPGGKLFTHIFCHREYAYLYDDSDPNDWIARYFFTGGTMPSETLFSNYPEHFSVEERWRVSGVHYAKTCRAWLRRTDAQRGEILQIFDEVYGPAAMLWFARWRVFFMACEELFAYRKGQEWFVSHTRFSKR